jgi:hypothetical protein
MMDWSVVLLTASQMNVMVAALVLVVQLQLGEKEGAVHGTVELFGTANGPSQINKRS